MCVGGGGGGGTVVGLLGVFFWSGGFVVVFGGRGLFFKFRDELNKVFVKTIIFVPYQGIQN